MKMEILKFGSVTILNVLFIQLLAVFCFCIYFITKEELSLFLSGVAQSCSDSSIFLIFKLLYIERIHFFANVLICVV
jgi:hypothetical protein